MMDLPTLFIGIGMVALIILPMLYFHLDQKKKRAAFLNLFKLRAQQQHVQVTQWDVWSNYCAIGLDTQAKKLYYLKKRGEQEQQLVINLSDVEKCSITHLKRIQNEDQIIDRLELCFAMRAPKGPEKSVEFYSKDESMTLNGELQLVEKWKTIINAHLEVKRSLAIAS